MGTTAITLKQKQSVKALFEGRSRGDWITWTDICKAAGIAVEPLEMVRQEAAAADYGDTREAWLQIVALYRWALRALRVVRVPREPWRFMRRTAGQQA